MRVRLKQSTTYLPALFFDTETPIALLPIESLQHATAIIDRLSASVSRTDIVEGSWLLTRKTKSTNKLVMNSDENTAESDDKGRAMDYFFKKIEELKGEIEVLQLTFPLLSSPEKLQERLDEYPMLFNAIYSGIPVEQGRKQLIARIQQREADIKNTEELLAKQSQPLQSNRKRDAFEISTGISSHLRYDRLHHKISTTSGTLVSSMDGELMASFPLDQELLEKIEVAWNETHDATAPHDRVVGMLPRLNSDSVRNACMASRFLFEVIESDYNTIGEMTYQQLVYSPFSMLFMAAAGGHNTLQYAADLVVKCSLLVACKAKADEEFVDSKMSIKPDAAATLGARWDAFAMMELKRSEQETDAQLVDKDKCVLMTSVTAIILGRCIDQKDFGKIALPFIIAAGKKCSLYVTTLDIDGNPCIKHVCFPDGNTATNVNVGKSPSKERTQMLIALAMLLNNLNEFFGSNESALRKNYATIVKKAKDAQKGYPEYSFTGEKSKDGPRKRNASANSDMEIGGKKQRGTPEEAALDAAACGGMFRNLTYPFIRGLHFTDSDAILDEQKVSPFYFKCTPGFNDLELSDTKEIFLKVWKVEEIDVGSVESEWSYHQKAFEAGVPVAAPVLPEMAKSQSANGSEYLIFAADYIHEDHIESPRDFLQFCSALIDTVEKLHNQAGILHCDLKPDNIRWSNGEVRLIDFGHAQSITKATWCRGTEGFEAPEILKKMPNSTKTDAFSVGQIILTLLGRFKDGWLQDGSHYGRFCNILEQLAKHLTDTNPRSRWSLATASNKLQDSFANPRPVHREASFTIGKLNDSSSPPFNVSVVQR